MATVAFELGGGSAAVMAELVGLGFTFGPARPMTTIVLDTFDGRLHRAGLRLECQESDGAVLVLSGHDTVPARLAVAIVPRLPDALPVGSFRSRLERCVGLRALLPQLRVATDRRTGVWRDADGKVVSTVDVNESARIVHPSVADARPTLLDVHEVAGYVTYHRRVVRLLEELGLSHRDEDAVSQWATVAGVGLEGVTSTPSIPLDPDMPAADGYRAVLANLASAITANWQGTIDRSDTEFLHDLRIAVRRSRTVLGDAAKALPDEPRAAAREGLAWIAALTGPPRDLDVYLLEWSQYVAPLGAEATAHLAPVHALLLRRCDDAHGELERALRSPRAREIIESWTSWLGAPLDESEGPGRRPLGRLVAARIARAHTIVIDRGRLIDPATPAERVHDLRKDAKKLRYLLECFGTILPDGPRRRFVKRLKALQDNLGEHQDAEVHMAMLKGIAHELHDAGASSDTIVAIGQLTERLDRQRRRARDEFAERFQEFDTETTQRAMRAMLDGLSR